MCRPVPSLDVVCDPVVDYHPFARTVKDKLTYEEDRRAYLQMIPVVPNHTLDDFRVQQCPIEKC